MQKKKKKANSMNNAHKKTLPAKQFKSGYKTHSPG